jgi:transcriptional regulator with GAF, ATPase, and Fis domain
MEAPRRGNEPVADQAFAAFFARVLPLLPRGWGASLQIEDPLTRSLEEVARGGHAVVEKAHLLSLLALSSERVSQAERWAMQQVGISEHRLLPLPGERSLGRLVLLCSTEAPRLDEASARDLTALCSTAGVELERARAQREHEKFAKRLRWITELELSDSFTSGCLALLPEVSLAAVFAVTDDTMSVLIIKRRDGEAVCEFNRQTVPLGGSHLAALCAGVAEAVIPRGGSYSELELLAQRLAGASDRRTREPLAPAFIETVPLEPAGRVVGSLVLFHRSQPTAPARAFVRHLADAFAASLDKIRPERRHAASFLYLQELFRNSGRSLAPLLQTVTEEMIRFLGANAGVIALQDVDTGRLLLSEVLGYGGTAVLPQFIPLEETAEARSSIVAHVLRSGEPYVASDTRTAAFYLPADPSICSEIGVPLRLRGETFGVALASSHTRGYFTEDDINRFQIFADQVALAVDNARLIDSLRARHERDVARQQRREFGFDRTGHAEDLEYFFGNLIGDPRGPMGEVYRTIERVAAREDDTVLVIGETGTGKEMIAHAIHHASPRRPRPMIATNFAALGGDPNLIQSELFGHERGAFTGATSRRKGCFETAHKSTLFIDEVGDIVPQVQVKLLRVLGRSSQRDFSRLGGEEPIRTNVRVLAATNKDLVAEIRANRFREDLYYRLSALVVRIPPLRERTSDIPLLLRHIIARMGRGEVPIGKGVAEALCAYHWPGNIRQLESVVLRALALYGRPDELLADDVRRALEAEDGWGQSTVAPLPQCPDPAPDGWFWDTVWPLWKIRKLPLHQLEELVRRALAETGGFYSRAASRLGVSAQDYQRFIDFLAHAGVKIDYQQFRSTRGARRRAGSEPAPRSKHATDGAKKD